MGDRPFDVVLIGSDDSFRIQAHKNVLSTSSDFFRRMFSKASGSASSNEVRLPEIDGLILKPVVDFIYTGAIEFIPDNVETILAAASFLHLEELKAKCRAFLGVELESPSPKDHTCIELGKIEFLLSDVLTEQEFLQLDVKQLEKYLSGDDLSIDSEEQVFLSIIAWIEHDKPNRERFIRRLMNSIRFPFLDCKFIINMRFSVCKSLEFYELLCSWLQWHLSPATRLKFPIPKFRPRKKDSKLAFVSGLLSTDIQMQTYDAVLNYWAIIELPPPPTQRTKYGAIVINKKLIVVGGKIDGIETNCVECLDLKTLEWTELPSMEWEVCSPALADLEGDLYVIGGQCGQYWTSFVQRYDFSLREWHNMEPLRSPLIWVNVCVHRTNIYAVGNGYPFMECYIPQTNEWLQRSYKNEESKLIGFASVGKHLYAVGGYRQDAQTTTRTIERYDPFTDSWIFVTPMKKSRDQVRCVGYRNRLIACGGFMGNVYIDTVEEYNPLTDEWTTLAPLLPCELRYSHSNLFTYQC